VTCSHSASESLFDLVLGRLPASAAERVREHAAACAECASRLETLEWIRGHVTEWGEGLFADHLPSEEIVRYAETGTVLTPERLRALERHLYVCEACAADLATVKEVGATLGAGAAEEGQATGEAGAEPGGSGPRGPRPRSTSRVEDASSRGGWVRRFSAALGARRWGGVPAWAYAAALVLAVPAAFGVRGWLAGGEATPGAIRSLPPPLMIPAAGERGPAGTFRVPVTGQTVVLGVEVPVTEESGVRYAALLRDDTGKVLWRDDHVVPTDRFGTMLVEVPAVRLRPGPHEMVVREIRPGATTPGAEFRFPFTVSR